MIAHAETEKTLWRDFHHQQKLNWQKFIRIYVKDEMFLLVCQKYNVHTIAFSPKLISQCPRQLKISLYTLTKWEGEGG